MTAVKFLVRFFFIAIVLLNFPDINDTYLILFIFSFFSFVKYFFDKSFCFYIVYLFSTLSLLILSFRGVFILDGFNVFYYSAFSFVFCSAILLINYNRLKYNEFLLFLNNELVCSINFGVFSIFSFAFLDPLISYDLESQLKFVFYSISPVLLLFFSIYLLNIVIRR